MNAEPQITEPALTADKVTEVFLDCLFRDDEPKYNYIKAEGPVHNVGFHPGRLEEHRAEIEALLSELPDQFKQTGGGGWSFLNACRDKHGRQWGEHIHIEQLCQLGIGIGKGAWLMPRSMWGMFPGGLPYYVVKDKPAVDPVDIERRLAEVDVATENK